MSRKRTAWVNLHAQEKVETNGFINVRHEHINPNPPAKKKRSPKPPQSPQIVAFLNAPQGQKLLAQLSDKYPILQDANGRWLTTCKHIIDFVYDRTSKAFNTKHQASLRNKGINVEVVDDRRKKSLSEELTELRQALWGELNVLALPKTAASTQPAPMTSCATPATPPVCRSRPSEVRQPKDQNPVHGFQHDANKHAIEQMYTPSHVANLLSVDDSFVHDLIKAGKLRHINLTPEMVRIPESSLGQYLSTLRARSGPR